MELDHWEAFWTDEKKAYCCGVVGHGCAAEPLLGQVAILAMCRAKQNWAEMASQIIEVKICKSLVSQLSIQSICAQNCVESTSEV